VYLHLILLSSTFLFGHAADLPSCLTDCGVKNDCDCSNKAFTRIPDELPTGIKSLDLSFNQIHNVSRIPEVNTLEKIDLSNNGIFEISYDAFDNLDYVDVLILSNNSLESITEDIFEWNPLQLKVLHLDHNKMEFVQHFLLYDLDQLMEIDLSYNSISFIHPHAFGQQKKLLRLNLSGNNLATIKHQWFKSFSTSFLESVKIAENPISCDCAMNDTLKWIRQPEQKWFRSFMKDVTCTKPEKLKGKAIAGKKSINLPDLKQYCGLPTITGVSQDTTLAVGKNIQLQCNAIGTPTPTIDWKSPQNDIYNFHNADHFDGIHAHSNGSLVIMDLQGDDFGSYTCIATSKGGSVEQVVQLTKMAGHDDSKPVLPAPADEMHNAAHKNISADDQTVVHDFNDNQENCHAQCTCHSRRADCSSKQITEVPDYGDIPPNTITYNLAGNRIKKVGIFGNYAKLVELSLDDNVIEEIEAKAFKNLAQLQTLTLRNNRIKTIKTHTFQNLKKLTILVLDHNELETISESYFKPFEKLQWLYVRNNNIKQINQKSFSDLNQIKFIHMENNALPNIQAGVVKDLTEKDGDVTITRIFVDDNPFYCDCQMEPLHQYIASEEYQKKHQHLFGEGIKCRFPAEYSEFHLDEIDMEEVLKCDNSSGTAVIPLPKQNETLGSSAATAMWFGGLILGVVLCIATIFLSKRYGRKICGGVGGSARYSSIAGADQSDYAALTANSGGSEAFI